MNPFTDRLLLDEPHVRAPDTSEIRLLAETARASMCHARLPACVTTPAVRHRTVDEVWLCVAGAGEIWRSIDGHESIAALAPGCSVGIPCGTAFQWRNLGDEPLDVVITTVPRWPGPDEATFVDRTW